MDNSRDNLQRAAFDQLLTYKRLVLKWGTSTGKSRVGVLAAQHIINNCRGTPKVLIMVAETSHKENWRQEFIKFLGEEESEKILRYITFECYASIAKHKDSLWHLIIFDEAHHLKSELRQAVLETIGAEYVLALSATLPESVLNILSQTFGSFKQSNVTLQNAIDAGYISEPKIICIALELERFKRNRTIVFDWRTKKVRYRGELHDIWSNRWKYLKNKKKLQGFTIHLSCTQKEEYEYIDEQFKYWKGVYLRNPGNEVLKNKWLQWGSKRKRFLGELKTGKALEIVERLRAENKRFICFCSSIAQAQCLHDELSIHSHNPLSLKIIDLFNKKEINELFAVGMLQEGQNLTDIQAGIIIQLDGEERGFIQKFGRTLRAESPVQYILYYKNTRDEEYLEKALEGMNKNYITYEDNNNG